VLKIALNSKEEDLFKKSAQKLRNAIEQFGLDYSNPFILFKI